MDPAAQHFSTGQATNGDAVTYVAPSDRRGSAQVDRSNGKSTNAEAVTYLAPPDRRGPARGDRSNRTSTDGHITNSAPSVPEQKVSRNRELINFIIQWTCGILAAASAIVFGIWAPLSYEATASGNKSNDGAQSTMVDALSSVGDMADTANSIAMTATSIAKSAATAQSSALLDMQNQMARMGQLAVIDFCITQSSLAVCSSYIQDVNPAITSLVDILGFPTMSTTAVASSWSAADSPAAPVPSDSTAIATGSEIVASSVLTLGPPTSSPATSSPATSGLATSSPATSGPATSGPATSSPAASGPAASRHLGVGAVLSIVYGSILAVGAALAFFIWRYRYARQLLILQ